MNAVNMTPGTAGAAVKDTGILYTLMLVAAVGVIVFSIAGIAAMMGRIPGALTGGAKPAGVRIEARSRPRRAAWPQHPRAANAGLSSPCASWKPRVRAATRAPSLFTSPGSARAGRCISRFACG